MKKRSPAGKSSESALKKCVTCEPCACQSLARSGGRLKRRSRRIGIMAFLPEIPCALLSVIESRAWRGAKEAAASDALAIHLRGALRAFFGDAFHAARLHHHQRLIGRR